MFATCEFIAKRKFAFHSLLFHKKGDKKMVTEKRNITPQKALEILSKSGVKITHKKAEDLLDFMYLLAKLIVNQNISK